MSSRFAPSFCKTRNLTKRSFSKLKWICSKYSPSFSNKSFTPISLSARLWCQVLVSLLLRPFRVAWKWMQSRFFRGCRLVCWIFLQVLPLLWIPCRVFQRLRVFKFLSASLPRIQPSHLFCIIHFMSPLDFNRNQLDSRVQRRPRLPTLCLPMDFLKLQLRMVDFLAVDFLVVDFRACLAPPLSRLCQLLFPKPLLSQFLPLRWHKRQAQKVHQSATKRLQARQQLPHRRVSQCILWISLAKHLCCCSRLDSWLHRPPIRSNMQWLRKLYMLPMFCTNKPSKHLPLVARHAIL